MEDEIRLVIYTPSGYANTLSVEEYLIGREKGTINWVPNLDDSSLQLWSGEEEWIACAWNLGLFTRMIQQLEAAFIRASQTLPFIIRSAVYDAISDGLPYILFEPPTIADTWNAFMFPLGDVDEAEIFPDEADGPELYKYVMENRERLLADLDTDTYREFRSVPISAQALLEGLEREPKLGRKLCELLGEEI